MGTRDKLRFALRLTMIAYLFIITTLCLLNPSFIRPLSQFLARYVLMPVPGARDTLYGDVFVSSVGAMILLWSLYTIRRAALERNAEAVRAYADRCGGDGAWGGGV